jgi:hypothetical protein
MKYSHIFLLCLSMHAFGQAKKDSCCIARKDLVGVWQRDSKRVGNGLGQNITFFSDGRFLINLGDERDDARALIALRGRYRLVKNELYITILSRKVVEGGHFAIDDPGISLGIFSIVGGNIRDIAETNPAEIDDPLEITIIKKGNIKLGSETYYKISKEVLAQIKFTSDR